MKICPHCQNTYTDDSLQYCLQDGTPLDNYRADEDWSENETVISARKTTPQTETWSQPEPIPVQPREVIPIPVQRREPEPTPPPVVQYVPEPEPKSSSVKTIVLTMLGTLLLASIGGLAAWMLLRDRGRDVAVNVNTNPPANASVKTPTPTPNINTNSNANAVSNINTSNSNALGANIQTPTPQPKPTLKPEEIEQSKTEVQGVIDDWKASSEVFDLNENLKNYAPTVDYYKAGKVPVSKVRSDKQQAYGTYDRIQIDISNMRVETDPSGEKATATFDKEWFFDNPEKTNSGKVQQQLQFTKIGGKWKISGEKDLKIYYVNRN